MRLVIENGKHYKSDNFFIMLKEIKPEYIDASAKRFLDIMIDELKITRTELEKGFSRLGGKDEVLPLKEALSNLYNIGEPYLSLKGLSIIAESSKASPLIRRNRDIIKQHS